MNRVLLRPARYTARVGEFLSGSKREQRITPICFIALAAFGGRIEYIVKVGCRPIFCGVGMRQAI
jgi:hypothetical protein